MCGGAGDLLQILRNVIIKFAEEAKVLVAEGGHDYAKLRDVQVTRFRLREMTYLPYYVASRHKKRLRRLIAIGEPTWH